MKQKRVNAHTPGPWTIITNPCTINGVCHSGPDLRKGWPRIVGTDGHSVADVVTHSARPFEANARLIAAAPALLGALKRALGRIEHHTASVESCDLEASDELTMEQARAAIAQVEGGEK